MIQNPDDYLNKVIIENGEIKSGGLDKKIFTATSKGLIHTIYNDLGPERTKCLLIDDLQKITAYFLLIEGFSVGIGDMIADEETNEKIRDVIDENKMNIEKIIQEFILIFLKISTTKTNKEYFENKVNSLLNKTLSQTSNIGLKKLGSKK